MRRPYIVNVVECKGTGTLKQTGAAAELIQLGLDEQTGAPCYVIRADGSWPFAVWPDELLNVSWQKPARCGITMAMTKIPMRKIVSRHRDTRGALVDWFAEDAMRFFGTKLPEHGLALGSRIAFVTSEVGPSNLKAYSVRSFDWNTGSVCTVGEFQEHATKRAATAAAKQFLLTA